MKYLPFICLFFIYSCSTKTSKKSTIKISSAQKGIQNLIDSFRSDYKSAKNDILKNSVVEKYNPKIYDYLASIYIDSISVHIDSVIINDLKVTTKSHCNNDIAFQYSMTFLKSMDKIQDSLFRFMKGLIPGTDTTINFSYMGSHELSSPLDTSSPTLKIFAFPTPQFSKRE